MRLNHPSLSSPSTFSSHPQAHFHPQSHPWPRHSHLSSPAQVLVTQGFSGQSCSTAPSDSAGYVPDALCASLRRRYFWFPHSRGTETEIHELCQAFAMAELETWLMQHQELCPGPFPTALALAQRPPIGTSAPPEQDATGCRHPYCPGGRVGQAGSCASSGDREPARNKRSQSGTTERQKW